jgi:hypothetical protein
METLHEFDSNRLGLGLGLGHKMVIIGNLGIDSVDSMHAAQNFNNLPHNKREIAVRDLHQLLIYSTMVTDASVSLPMGYLGWSAYRASDLRNHVALGLPQVDPILDKCIEATLMVKDGIGKLSQRTVDMFNAYEVFTGNELLDVSRYASFSGMIRGALNDPLRLSVNELPVARNNIIYGADIAGMSVANRALILPTLSSTLDNRVLVHMKPLLKKELPGSPLLGLLRIRHQANSYHAGDRYYRRELRENLAEGGPDVLRPVDMKVGEMVGNDPYALAAMNIALRTGISPPVVGPSVYSVTGDSDVRPINSIINRIFEFYLEIYFLY